MEAENNISDPFFDNLDGSESVKVSSKKQNFS